MVGHQEVDLVVASPVAVYSLPVVDGYLQPIAEALQSISKHGQAVARKLNVNHCIHVTCWPRWQLASGNDVQLDHQTAHQRPMPAGDRISQFEDNWPG
jgi:hypothetical protein